MFTGLKNSVAIINGAAGGMGTQTAIRLGKEGCKIFAVDMSEEKLKVMKAKLAGLGITEVTTCVCNSAKEEDVNSAVAMCLDTYGTITILFNVCQKQSMSCGSTSREKVKNNISIISSTKFNYSFYYFFILRVLENLVTH